MSILKTIARADGSRIEVQVEKRLTYKFSPARMLVLTRYHVEVLNGDDPCPLDGSRFHFTSRRAAEAYAKSLAA